MADIENMAQGSPAQRVKRAMEADVPHLYINGFVNSLTNGDVLVVLENSGQPVATINMSFTVAKTWSIGLSRTVAQLEAATGKAMLTTQEVEAALAKTESDKH